MPIPKVATERLANPPKFDTQPLRRHCKPSCEQESVDGTSVAAQLAYEKALLLKQSRPFEHEFTADSSARSNTRELADLRIRERLLSGQYQELIQQHALQREQNDAQRQELEECKRKLYHTDRIADLLQHLEEDSVLTLREDVANLLHRLEEDSRLAHSLLALREDVAHPLHHLKDDSRLAPGQDELAKSMDSILALRQDELAKLIAQQVVAQLQLVEHSSNGNLVAAEPHPLPEGFSALATQSPQSPYFLPSPKPRYSSMRSGADGYDTPVDEDIVNHDDATYMSQQLRGHDIGFASGNLNQSLDDVKTGHLKDHMDKLRKSLETAEEIERRRARRSVSSTLTELDTHEKDTALDVVMAVLIIANAIIIGISLDHDAAVFNVLNTVFTACFIVELMCKFKLHGLGRHFFDPSNVVDFLLVVLDVTQIILELLRSDLMADAPAASMFRVVRLLRLVRLIRLIRLKIMDDLVALITGMIGGISTLMWSMVLLFIILYVTSLVFREFYGLTFKVVEDEDITFYFSSVPRSMLTVFRYFLSDFNTINGISLLEAIQRAYGTKSGVLVSTLSFVITIGLFNVIAAIFVENVLDAATSLRSHRRSERLNDTALWGTRISVLIRKLLEHNGNKLSRSIYEDIEETEAEPISESVFQRFLEDPTVIKALHDLEIDAADHKYLFDILDNDNTGEIFISQFSDGLERLRGEPRRSDTITINLMVRAVQEQTNFLVKGMETSLELLYAIKKGVIAG